MIPYEIPILMLNQDPSWPTYQLLDMKIASAGIIRRAHMPRRAAQVLILTFIVGGNSTLDIDTPDPGTATAAAASVSDAIGGWSVESTVEVPN